MAAGAAHRGEDVCWFRSTLAGEAFVFEEDGAVLGVAVLRADELPDLHVAPDARRRGIGSALVAHVQSLCPTASASGRSATTPVRAGSTTRAAAA